MGKNHNQRQYTRGSHINGTIKVSVDGMRWAKAKLADVSSGGLGFSSGANYSVGDTLWFDLMLEGFLTEFEVKSLGVIRRKTQSGDCNHYGVSFQGLSREKQIQIDENVRHNRPIGGGRNELG